MLPPNPNTLDSDDESLMWVLGGDITSQPLLLLQGGGCQLERVHEIAGIIIVKLICKERKSYRIVQYTLQTCQANKLDSNLLTLAGGIYLTKIGYMKQSVDRAALEDDCHRLSSSWWQPECNEAIIGRASALVLMAFTCQATPDVPSCLFPVALNIGNSRFIHRLFAAPRLSYTHHRLSPMRAYITDTIIFPLLIVLFTPTAYLDS